MPQPHPPAAAEADLIDHALARRSARLAFPPALERRYEMETGRLRCHHLAMLLSDAPYREHLTYGQMLVVM